MDSEGDIIMYNIYSKICNIPNVLDTEPLRQSDYDQSVTVDVGHFFGDSLVTDVGPKCFSL